MRRKTKEDETIEGKLDSFLGKGITSSVSDQNLVNQKDDTVIEDQTEIEGDGE